MESECRKADAKVGIIFELPKLFEFFFIYYAFFLSFSAAEPS